MSSPNESVAIRMVAACEHCPEGMGTDWTILFEMEPRRPADPPWFLCARHWFDGLHPGNNREFGAKAVAIVDPPAAVVAAPAPVTTKRRR